MDTLVRLTTEYPDAGAIFGAAVGAVVYMVSCGLVRRGLAAWGYCRATGATWQVVLTKRAE